MLETNPTDSISRRGLREEVYDAVLRMLLEGRIASGERLSIEDLARTLSVSPTPVREALVLLERTGLVSRVALRGYRVAPPLDEHQLEGLFDARMLLEVEAARKGFASRENLLTRLRAITAEHDELASRIIEYGPGGDASALLDLTQAYFTMDAAFHRAIFDAADNHYLSDMYDSLGALTHRMRQTAARGPSDMHEATREHHAIVEAFSRSELDAAEAMRAHIQNVRARSLGRIDPAQAPLR